MRSIRRCHGALPLIVTAVLERLDKDKGAETSKGKKRRHTPGSEW